MKINEMFKKYPWIISLLLILLLSVWIASGTLQDRSEEKTAVAQQEETKPAKVRVRLFHPEPVEQSLVLYGRTEPDRKVTLRAEVSGRIEEIVSPRGSRLAAEDLILRIALDERKQQLASALALRDQRLLEYEGAKSLSNKGYQGKAKLAEALAALRESQALIAKLEKEIENTQVKAPFDGILQDRFVESGDFVSIGDQLAMVVDLDPIIVAGDASEHDVKAIFTGQKAWVTLSDGSRHAGSVRYLAPISDKETNTFRLEVALSNHEQQIFAGLTAQIEIRTAQIDAIKISPALFSLSEKGDIGVKWVQDDIVRFTPIDIVKTESSGAWITGFDQAVQLITVGQAFVREGDRVEAISEEHNNS